MRATIFMVVLVALMSVGIASADFREVTCGSGLIGGLCHEKELQDEFNQLDHRNDVQDQWVNWVEDRVDDAEDDIDDLERDQRVQWRVLSDHGGDISQLQDDMGENNDRDDRQDDKIRAGEKKDKSQDRTIKTNDWKSTMGDVMLGYGLYKNGVKDQALQDYVEAKEAQWSEDRTGSSGISRRNLENWLESEFLEFLTGFFVQHAELEAAQKRIDALEARLGVLERAFTIEATQEQMDCATAMVEAERTGEKAYVGSVQYDPDNAIMGCVIFG